MIGALGFAFAADTAHAQGKPVALGGQAPWTNLNAPNIAVDLGYAFAPDVSIGIAPTIGSRYESGASMGDALICGAIVSATKVFSPSLVLAIGENRFVPLFARVTRSLGPQPRDDFYAGVSVEGRLSVDDVNGNAFAQDDYKTARAIGITLAHR
jgi:hypothetical protein